MRSRFAAVLVVALGVACRGANVPLDQLENLIRVQIVTTSDDLDLSRPQPPPLHKEVLDAAKNAGASQQELESVLFSLVDKTIAAGGDPRRGVGDSALGILGEIGSAAVLNRVTAIALNGPTKLRSSARTPSLLIANREAPALLSEVAGNLLRSDPEKRAYGTLHHILRERLPAEQGERERRMAAILAIFKEGLRDGAYGDRIYLDRVLEEFDAAYRTSEERRRFLTEESRSENPIVKKYAEEKLRSRFSAASSSPSLPVANVAPTQAQPASKKSTALPQRETEAKPHISASVYLVDGATALVLLALVLYKLRTKG